MNKPAFRRCARSLGIMLSLAVAACHPAAPPAAPLAGASIGGPFALVDQDGRAVTDRHFAGKWRAIYFGYTYCPDACPTNLQHLMQGYALFSKAAPAGASKLQPIFISIDPARDTPAVLKQYVAAFGSKLIGLTGTEDQIADVAKRYRVSYRKGKADSSGQYLMDHLSATMLFDPSGAPIALLPTDANGPAVAAELAKWVR